MSGAYENPIDNKRIANNSTRPLFRIEFRISLNTFGSNKNNRAKDEKR